MDLGAKRRVGGGFAWLYCPFHLCVCVCVYVCGALLCCGIREVAEIEGSLRVGVAVGFAWFEGVLAKFTERHTVRVVARSLSFVCVCVGVCMCVAESSAAGSEGFVEFEGSRGCRLRMVVGFARLEGLRGWRTNYLRRRCPVDLSVCVCICV